MLDVVVAVAAGDVVTETYALAPPRDVVVIVHDEDGAPLHVGVELLIGDPRVPAGLDATDDAGSVVFPGLAHGEHEIVIGGAVRVTAGPAGPGAPVPVAGPPIPRPALGGGGPAGTGG